jgi:ribosomal subunit interface protein
MRNPVDITLRGVAESGALQRYIGDAARRLERQCDRMQACHVVVEALHYRRLQGAQFAVRINITLPGTEVVVNREHGEDVYIALRNAFEAASRQLKDSMRRLGNVGRRSRNGTANPGS